MRVFRGRLSICMCASFPYGFEGGMWDLMELVPDHCLSSDGWQLRILVQNNSWGKVGMSLSPTLFNIFLEKIRCDTLEEHNGMFSSIGTKL